MAHNKKIITVLILVSIAIIATAAGISHPPRYKNLKVLPQDITERELDSVMHAYTTALKVSCDFCHTAPKPLFSFAPANTNTPLDFSLDNPMKENARKMIHMQMDINTSYFKYDSLARPAFLNVVNCNTCHRGSPYPVNEH